MTDEEKKEIVAEVIQTLKTNAVTVDQLNEVLAYTDDDYVELNKGRKMKVKKIEENIASGIDNKYGVTIQNLETKDDEIEAYSKKITTEYNVSTFHSTSGIDGTNRYDLATAIVQVPAELRTSGLTVSFLNESGDTEKWEFGGSSWVVSSFSQVGAEKLTELSDNVGLYNVDKNVPLGSGFYTSTTARSAVPTSVRKIGLIITYKTDSTTSQTEQFVGSSISSWATDSNWKNVGSEGSNKILVWKTDVATTRKQVAVNERKAGMQISYKPEGLDWVNEQYIGTDLDDKSWVSDSNWKPMSQKIEVDKVLDEESEKPIANSAATRGINEVKEQLSTQLTAIEQAKESAIESIGDKESEAIQNFSDQRVTPGMLSPETMQIINASGGGTINNLPDGETLSEVELAEGVKAIGIPDRSAGTNMGYVILKKNKSLIQQVTKENTIYEVRYTYDLGGETLEMPDNCMIRFDGGIISNGKLIGSHTKFEANSGLKIFSNDVTFEGTFDIPNGTFPEWFGVKTLKITDKTGEFISDIEYPSEIDNYPDSSDSINNALKLAKLAGSICYLNGGVYKIEKTINVPKTATLYIDTLSVVCAYMEGSGLDADGNKVYSLNYTKYIPTQSMAKAISADTAYTKIIGGGRLCLFRSKYTIGIYILGLPYHYNDMMFFPETDIRIIGGCDGSTWAAADGDIIREGKPNDEEGVDGDYALDTTEMKIYKKTSGTWSYSRNGNCLYNTCFRIETPGKETSVDNRVMNTRYKIGAMYSFRGIEIVSTSPGWQNSVKYDGTVSNCSSSFLSIFAGVWFGDFSGMNFQIGQNMNRDCKIIYSLGSAFVRFGMTWDLEFSEVAKAVPRYYFGEGTQNNIIEVWSENEKYYEDFGKNNVFLPKEGLSDKLLSETTDSISWRNIWQFRSPFNAMDSYGKDDGGFQQIEEIVTDSEIEDKLKTTKILVSEDDGIISVPKIFYDCSVNTFYDVITSINNKKTAYMQLYCPSFSELYPNNGWCLEFDYKIVNPNNGSAYNEMPVEISAFYNTMIASPTVKKRLTIKTDGDGFTGQRQVLNTTRIKLSRSTGVRLGFKFETEPDAETPVALRIYNIRLLYNGTKESIRNNISSSTKNLPDSCPKGFKIFDETLNKIVVNIGDSDNIQWFGIGESSTINKNTDETTITIVPNVLYLWQEVKSLNITLSSGTPNDEYMFQFTSGETPTNLQVNSIKWIGGTPSIEKNTTYQVSIVNNIAVIGGV